MQRLKDFLYKYIYLPITYLLWGMPTEYKDFAEYYEQITLCAEALARGNKVLVTVNGVKAIISRVDGKLAVKTINGDE